MALDEFHKAIYWRVCTPELAAKQNPPAHDGTDPFMSEIGAVPDKFRWTWVSP